MAVIELQDLMKPISNSTPVGCDVFYDEDFVSIKEKRAVVEERSLGVWKEKKLPELENSKSITSICVDILKNKSKNIQVVAYLLEELVKMNALDGLEEGLEILTIFCENFWENCFPLLEEAHFLEERTKIFIWMDDKITAALRFSHLLSSYMNVNLSFDEIESVNKIGFYAKKSSGPISSEIQFKYQLFIKNGKENLIQDKILNPIKNSIEKIKNLENSLKLKIDFGNNFFSHMLFLLNDMDKYFKSTLNLLNKKNIPVLENNSQLNMEEEVPTSLNGADDRNAIYEKIESLGKRLLILDPHSPVPHFLFKLLSWKNKSFLEIVPELGLNSPLLQFLNVSQKEGGDESANKKMEEKRPRRFIDPDDD